MFTMTITIIAITVIVSMIAFNKEEVMEKLIFYPPAVSQQNQYYRFISCGFIHADFMHLAFNMISFYLFGQALVEPAFIELFGQYGKAAYLAMYILALIVCLLPTYFNNRDNTRYRSLGASGAVSAVVFAGVLISPLSKLGFFFIPPVIPGFIFGPLYLLFSWYLDKKGGDNINHSAHIWGALFGVAFIIIASKLYGTTDVWEDFVVQIKYYFETF
ncbi:MAG: rhomboid family intramembrane serine protease, partial [Chitinophagaceae bacterium]